MIGNVSRKYLTVGLNPGSWVNMGQKEEPRPGVQGGYGGIDLHVECDINNTANVTVRIQDSADGVTWENRYTHANAVVPGGEVGFQAAHLGRWVRIMVYSEGTGRVEGTLLTPEPFANNPVFPEDPTDEYD